ITGGRREYRTDKKGNGDDPVGMYLAAVYLMDGSGICEQGGRDDGKNAQDLPLSLEECHSTGSDKARELLHFRLAGLLLAHPLRLDRHYQQSKKPKCGHKVNYVIVHILISSASADHRNRLVLNSDPKLGADSCNIR